MNLLSREDSSLLTHALDAETYSHVISAFRAQGSLDSYRNLVLEHLRKTLNISWSRHLAEIRRATADNLLTNVASELNPNCDVTFDWVREGTRVESDKNVEEDDESFLDIADSLQNLASKHNSTKPKSLFDLLKLPSKKNIPEHILAIFEKHLSHVNLAEGQFNETQSTSNAPKRKRQISSSFHTDDDSPPANLPRMVAIPKQTEKQKTQSKFSKKSIDVPILPYQETYVPVTRPIPRSAPAHQTKKAKKRQSASSNFQQPILEKYAPAFVPASTGVVEPEPWFQTEMNVTESNVTVVSESYVPASPSVSKKESDVGPSFNPANLGTASMTSPSPSALPASRSEPIPPTQRAYSGITVKSALPSANLASSPVKQSMRTVYTNFHTQQASRVAPELARSIGAGGQKVIVLPSSNLRRRLNLPDRTSSVLLDGSEFGSNSNDQLDDLDQGYLQAKQSASYNTKGAGSDVIVVRRTVPEQQAVNSVYSNDGSGSAVGTNATVPLKTID